MGTYDGATYRSTPTVPPYTTRSSHIRVKPPDWAQKSKAGFSDQFFGKRIFKDGKFLPIAVVKAGQHPAGDEDYVDGISGGTITSKGVAAMIDNCLSPYKAFLEKLEGGNK